MISGSGPLKRRYYRFRGMERGVKTFAIRMLAAVFPAPAPRAPPEWGAHPHRVLYLRYDRIGDMVLATGIIEAIVRAYPSVTIDVLASRVNATVLGGNQNVGRVLVFAKKRPWTYWRTLREIRRARYDAVLDAMVLSPSLTTATLMLLSGARHRIGVAGRGTEFAMTMPVPRAGHAVHYIDHSAALLTAFGIDPQGRADVDSGDAAGTASTPPGTGPTARASGAVPAASLDAPVGGWGVWRPRLYLSDDELAAGESQWSPASVEMGTESSTTSPNASPTTTRKTAKVDASGWHAPRRFALNVSAGAPSRYWPADRFVATITWMRDRYPGLSFLIVGSPNDHALMQEIGRGAGAPLAHTPTVRSMMAVIASADIVLTADTSVTHIASAFQRPAVVMFARGRVGLYGPYGSPGRAVSTPGPTLQSLATAPVVAALDDLMGWATRQAEGGAAAHAGLEAGRQAPVGGPS